MQAVTIEPVEKSAAEELQAVLDEQGEAAKRLEKAFHYAQLWRYRTGKGRPSLANATTIERLTDGRVPATGWATEAAEAS